MNQPREQEIYRSYIVAKKLQEKLQNCGFDIKNNTLTTHSDTEDFLVKCILGDDESLLFQRWISIEGTNSDISEFEFIIPWFDKISDDVMICLESLGAERVSGGIKVNDASNYEQIISILENSQPVKSSQFELIKCGKLSDDLVQVLENTGITYDVEEQCVVIPSNLMPFWNQVKENGEQVEPLPKIRYSYLLDGIDIDVLYQSLILYGFIDFQKMGSDSIFKITTRQPEMLGMFFDVNPDIKISFISFEPDN